MMRVIARILATIGGVVVGLAVVAAGSRLLWRGHVPSRTVLESTSTSRWQSSFPTTRWPVCCVADDPGCATSSTPWSARRRTTT